MKQLRKVFALVLALALVLVLAACGGSDSENEDTASTETLVMATSADFPPYEYVDGKDCVGIDIEIAQAIADKLGMKLDINNVEFSSVVAGVATGKYNMGMSGITVTDERKLSVDFSDSYTTAVQAVVVKEDSGYNSIDDVVKKEGFMIGVQLSTTGDMYVTDDYGEEHVTQYKTGADAIQALATDKIDAVVIDIEPAKAYVAANDGLKVLDTAYVEEEYAIALNKDNTELNEKINNALNELIEDGTVQKIIDSYISAE